MNKGRTSVRRTEKGRTNYRFAIVVSRFNETVTEKLLAGALACLKDHGVPKRGVGVYHCPGAFELPQVAGMLARWKRWDAIICLGAVIRGATPHFEYVSAEAARGIQDVALRYALPVVFGVLTTNTEQQAMERAGGRHGNKGWDAVLTAMEMSDLVSRMRSETKKSQQEKGTRRVG